MSEDIFIFTEAYNCGKIAKKALESFFKHHDHKVHVIGRHKDFKELKEFFDRIEIVEVSQDPLLEQYYKQGHLGTAYIFAKALQKGYGDYSKIVHFDSDVIFREECLADITDGFEEGYDLIGQRRPYKNNKANDKGQFDELEDVVGTCFFGINTDKISNYDFNTLHRMCVGYYNPHGHQVIDFFDPVSFDVIKNEGKVKYLDSKFYGSCDEDGNYDNGYPKLNELFDFGDKFIHFAGIGSGQNFTNNGPGNVPMHYVDWAKERYSMYMKLFYNEDVGDGFDQENYEIVKKLYKI